MSVDPTSPSAPPSDKLHETLPPGTRFGEFEILQVLGIGGFGVVYLAQDHSLERQVALKEYIPASLAVRGDGPAITVRSSAFAETYAVGLRSFINEARLLARFDHPSLVKVYRFWEDNGTAYMVMPFLQGMNLRDARRAMPQAPDEAWIRGVLNAMLDALDQLHREGVYHRDVAPDNILLPPEGSPILLDFGAARRVISDRTQSLTAILKPSYAPIEQYAEMATMRQGPWTDLYALGAVMHFLLLGAPPAPSTARVLQPEADDISQHVVPGVSPHFMGIVAWMLGVRPLDRPQSVADLRAVLSGQSPVPVKARKGVLPPADDDEKTRAMPAGLTVPLGPTLRHTAHPPTDALPRSNAGTLPAYGAPERRPVSPPAMAPQAASVAAAADAAPAGRRGFLMAGVGVLLLALVAAGLLWRYAGAPRATQVTDPTSMQRVSPPGVVAPYTGPNLSGVASVPHWGAGASSAQPAK